MRKVLVATHGRFAEGIRETMQFIMGDEGTVDVLNAYTSQEFDMHKEAERLVNNLGAGDELIVAADLFGGKCSQCFCSVYAYRKSSCCNRSEFANVDRVGCFGRGRALC